MCERHACTLLHLGVCIYCRCYELLRSICPPLGGWLTVLVVNTITSWPDFVLHTEAPSLINTHLKKKFYLSQHRSDLGCVLSLKNGRRLQVEVLIISTVIYLLQRRVLNNAFKASIVDLTNIFPINRKIKKMLWRLSRGERVQPKQRLRTHLVFRDTFYCLWPNKVCYKEDF